MSSQSSHYSDYDDYISMFKNRSRDLKKKRITIENCKLQRPPTVRMQTPNNKKQPTADFRFARTLVSKTAHKERLLPMVAEKGKPLMTDDGYPIPAIVAHHHACAKMNIQKIAKKQLMLQIEADLRAGVKPKAAFDLKSRIPFNNKSQPKPTKDVPRLSDAITKINSHERQKLHEKNIKIAYGSKVPNVSEQKIKGFITQYWIDRQAKMIETSRINKEMKKRLLNVKATVSTFR